MEIKIESLNLIVKWERENELRECGSGAVLEKQRTWKEKRDFEVYNIDKEINPQEGNDEEKGWVGKKPAPFGGLDGTGDVGQANKVTPGPTIISHT